MTAVSLVLALALAVPTPKDGAKDADAPIAAPTGPAPRILFVKADGDGKVRLAAQQPGVAGGAVAVQIQVGGPGAPGVPAQPQVIQRAFGGPTVPVELKDLKDVAVTTTNGSKVEIAEATKRLAAGGYVLIPSDGKAIAPEWLRLFRGDGVLVVTSPDLVAAAGGFGGGAIIINGNVGGAGWAPAIPVQPRIQPVPPPAPKEE